MGRGSAFSGVEIHGNSVRIVFSYQGKRCRETLKGMPPTPQTMRYAVRLRAQIQTEINAGVFDYAAHFPDSKRGQAEVKQSPSFTEMACKWLNGSDHLAPSTVYGYRKILSRPPLSDISDKPIDRLPFSELQALIAGHPWVSAKTRNHAISVLRGVLELAVMDGLLPTNPAAKLKFAKQQKPDPDPLTLDECNRVIDWLAKNKPDGVQNYFEFAIFTGLRTSELIALQWGDVDFSRQVVRVQNAKVMARLKSTKTHQIRDVRLNSRALAALNRQKALTYLAGKEVFIHPGTGQPYIGDKPPRLFWDAALKALGLRKRVAYQTRHTFATLNLMAGANPMWVARQMGHTTMKMLLDRYSKWIDSEDGQEADKLENVLGQNLGQTRGNHKQSKVVTNS